MNDLHDSPPLSPRPSTCPEGTATARQPARPRRRHLDYPRQPDESQPRASRTPFAEGEIPDEALPLAHASGLIFPTPPGRVLKRLHARRSATPAAPCRSVLQPARRVTPVKASLFGLSCAKGLAARDFVVRARQELADHATCARARRHGAADLRAGSGSPGNRLPGGTTTPAQRFRWAASVFEGASCTKRSTDDDDACRGRCAERSV